MVERDIVASSENQNQEEDRDIKYTANFKSGKDERTEFESAKKDDKNDSQDKKGEQLTPLDQIQKTAFESEVKKNTAKANFFKVMTWFVPTLISVIVAVVSVLIAIWANNTDNITKPMGALEADVANLKKASDTNQDAIQRQENRLYEYLNGSKTTNIKK